MALQKIGVTAVVLFWALAFMAAGARAQSLSRGGIAGTVTDPAGATVSEARISLLNSQQSILGTTESDAQGHFRFADVPVGVYEVRAARADFGYRSVPVEVSRGAVAEVTLVLEISEIIDHVTVTAETGQAQDIDRVAQQVNIISSDEIRQRVTAVLAHVADEEVGVSLQRTSPSIGAIFVRGLTGKNVAVYVDGVRYTTSAQRGGINTFFNLNEPSGLRAVEILRGPNSAQYGSDSLGGTINLISRAPELGASQPEVHGEINTFFTSADLSFGGNTLVSYGTQRFGLLANIASRRVNTLRPADGLDGHAAVTRFLGLPSNIFGDRLPDTAFTQYGGLLRLNFAPTIDNQFIVHYLRSQQDGGKRYDQLLGGDGNLIADLRNLMLDFLYGRYIKQGAGLFDTASVTVSYNSQREERVNQGGRGNPLAAITTQRERLNAFGLSFYLDKRLARSNTLLIGADFYRERMHAPAFTFRPATGLFTPSRPRVPDGAQYLAYGFYAQDAQDVIPGRLRLSAALRYSVASYRSKASNGPIVGGRPLFPDDSLRASDFAGRVGVVATPVNNLSIVFNYSRGFRAPNMTDLGTLGLTGDGFEVAAPDIAGLGGTIGTTADDRAVSTGRPVAQLGSEVSNNFDLGLHYRRGRLDTDLTLFRIDLNDTITKQALILPPGAVGLFLGDQPIVRQLPNGVVFVPASSTPVLARANYSDARLFGVEYTLDLRLGRAWSLGGNFTYIRARDKATGAPPNVEGGTPPPTGFLRLRYMPPGKRYWIEAYATLAGRQERLSTLDLADRRTGALRSRADIANFFNNGARVHGLIGPGPDGRFGTADDILRATGETLAQVQTRVLGAAASAPLFPYLPGYGLVNVRGGMRITERSEIGVDFENIGDKSYRGPSWGIDGPGRSVTLRYQYRF
jgi:outer membrane receptor protein involved in Fe transport